MRVAIPCESGRVSAHFGHAPEFAFFDIDPQTQEISGPQMMPSPPHEPGVLPGWIAQQRATVVLAGGMGGRAQQLFESHGIHVVVGVNHNDPHAAVAAFINGQLTGGVNPCSHEPGQCEGH